MYTYATTEISPCFKLPINYRNSTDHSKCEDYLNNTQEAGTYFQENTSNIIIHYEVNSANGVQE
jgi:hypothetical protein